MKVSIEFQIQLVHYTPCTLAVARCNPQNPFLNNGLRGGIPGSTFHVGALIKIRASARSAADQIISRDRPASREETRPPRKLQRQERQ